LYNTASAYGKRPSDFFRFETELGAWQFDEACLIVGRRVEQNVNSNQAPFAGFDLPMDKSRGFRSAKQLVRRKVKIRPDGTW